ncbi:MAG: hypothetical protein LBN43_00040 [Oscillospiraceae bacterium]|jgi:hypothetical protein|nr:hypothetical protein [Oscillospiraceae bacterium]
MATYVLGKTLNNGFAGSYARQPDMIVPTRPNGSANNIKFGTALVYNANGAVIPADATFTAAKFAGIAGKEIKTALNYADQNSGGEYLPNEPVSVFQRGSINVVCKAGVPAVGGAVYVRVAAGTGLAIGDLTAVSDTTSTVQLTNAQWGGTMDGNNVAELVLLTRANA